MNTDLTFYVKKYNLLNLEQCNMICEELTKVPFENHRFKHYNGNLQASEYDPKFYTSTSGHLSNQTYNLIMEAYWKCLLEYIQNIDLDWYKGWNGFTPPKFNCYTPKTEMKNHCDHIHDIFDGNIRGIPIISMIALINDEFEGGEFVMFEDIIYNLDKGQVLIFPSMFLFPHKVNTIILGKRISMVSWVF